MNHKIICGDAIEELKKLPENSVDACVTDPPYELNFMNKGWDRSGIAFHTEMWQELYRVLKPGAHILVAGIARTHHRMWVALEDAGFEIRDGIYHVFGSGFPKSTDISKQIDKCKAIRPDKSYDFGKYIKEKRIEHGISLTKMDELICNGTTNYSWFEGRPAGQRLPCLEEYIKMKEVLKIDDYWDVFIGEAERESIGRNNFGASSIYGSKIHNNRKEDKEIDITLSSTEEAIKWDGWGTALKPAVEIWCLARKPISERNIASNVLRWGCGGINVDGCRVSAPEGLTKGGCTKYGGMFGNGSKVNNPQGNPQGRFPANLILECCCEEDELVEGKAYSTHRNWKRDYKDESPSAFSLGVKKGDREVGYKGDCIIHTNPNCVCRMLDEQSGNLHESGNKSDIMNGDDINYKASSYHISYKGRANRDYGLQGGGASRFFKVIKVDQDNSFICDDDILINEVEKCGNILKNQKGDGMLNGVIMEAERYIQDVEQFLCGKKNTENTQKDMKSIISTLIKLMIELKTYNVCREETINYCMEESEKTIKLLMGLNTEDAKDVKNIRFLLNFKNVLRELIRDIASNVKERNYKNGEIRTENTTMNICKNITENIEQNKSFFYQAKASQNERWFYCTICKQAYPMKQRDKHIHNALENEKYKYLEFHPTQKPEELICYLMRLITPPNGTTIDPFLGSGTAIIAAEREGFNCVGIDSSPIYCEIAFKRSNGELTQQKISGNQSTIEKTGF